jgi:hypothetical protein
MWYITSKFISLQLMKYIKCVYKESNVSILLFIYHECFVNRDETPIAHIINQNKSSASHTCTTVNPFVSTFTSTNRTYTSCFITLALTHTVAVLRTVISKCPWFTYYKRQYDNCVCIHCIHYDWRYHLVCRTKFEDVVFAKFFVITISIITSPRLQLGEVLQFDVSFSLLFFHTFFSAPFLGDVLIKLYETL